MSISRVLSPVLIGRDSELSALEDALLSALRGDGGVVIVGGEAGMGKTRLVNMLAERGRRLGCVVLSGGCSEAELSLPYLPFLEAIGNYLATIDAASLATRLGSAAGEVAQLFPQLGARSDLAPDPSQAKLRMFESILMLLGDAASRRGLLLILEDLHWADPATRELLDYATRRLRSTKVLIVATYRTDEMHRKHALMPTIQGWRRSGQVSVIDLQPLTPAQLGDMVCAIFDEPSVSDEFRDFLHERTEGNPFVVEEMLRDAIDRGDVYRTESGWDRKTLADIRIPPNVRDTILQRLERLSHEDAAVLSAASAVGRAFDLVMLADVARVEQAEALTALEASVSAQLIEEEDRVSGRYRFRHALTREAIYEDLVVPRRQQFHSRIADVMKARGTGRAVDLANQLFMAGRNDEAISMSRTAAEEANQARAYRDAAELLQHAVPLVADPVERARMECQAADSFWNNNESATSKRLLEHAIPELEAAGLDVEAAGYRVLLGRCWWEMLRNDRATEEFEKARTVLERFGPSEALAVAYIRLSGMAAFNEERERGFELAKKAYDVAEKAGSEGVKAWSLNFRAVSEIGLGKVDEGFAHFDQSFRGALAVRLGFPVGNAVYNASWSAIHLARGRDLEMWLDRLDSAYPSGTEPWLPYVKGLAGLQRGNVREAMDLAAACVQRSKDAGHEKMVWRSQVLLAHVLAELGRPEEAWATMPPTSRRTDLQDVIYDALPRIRCMLAAGDREGAEAEAKSISPLVCAIGSPADAVAQGTADAGWLRSFISEVPAQGDVLALPRMVAANGRLALLEGRLEDARTLLTSAVAGFEREGFRLDVWHLAPALAEAEHGCGAVNDAKARLERVVAEAGAASALLAVRIADETAARLGITIAAESTAPEPVAAARIRTGERMVSVLFADVRGYTELSGQSDPADIAGRIASLQRWAVQEVARRNGIVDKFAGDAVMATFNVSGQSVDHTLQAFRAAVGIVDKASLAGLGVGAAVAVGPAVVGNLAESANVSVLGEVTNLAARLQAAAAAGEIMLSDEVYRRVREWLDGQHLQAERMELQLKGFSGPVFAYKVVTGTVAAVPS